MVNRMTTHIIQLTDKSEMFLQKQIGGKTLSFKTINAYLEFLIAKDMMEQGEDTPSEMTLLLRSPELREDIRSRYVNRDMKLKETQSIPCILST